jgi:hypothetical protein
VSQLLAGLQSNPNLATNVWKATGNQGAMPPNFLSQLTNYGGGGGGNAAGGPSNAPSAGTSYGGSSLMPNPYQGKELA